MKPTRNQRRAASSSGQTLLTAFESSLKLLRFGLYLAVLVFLTSGITFVEPDEDAVVYRLGQRVGGVRPPGLLLAWPAPIDQVVRVPSRRTHEVLLDAWAPLNADAPPATKPGEAQYAHLQAMSAGLRPELLPPKRPRALHPVTDGYTVTGDTNLVQGRFALRYRIRDAIEWLSQAQEVEPLLQNLFYRSTSHVLAQRSVDDAVSSGQQSLTEDVRARVQSMADALRLGVSIDRVEIREIGPPKQVLPAFEEVVSAQVEARTAIEQARTYEAQILPKAQAEAYRIRTDADSASAELLAKAQGEAEAFSALLHKHQQTPALVRARLLAETRDRVLARLQKKTVLPDGYSPVRVFLREDDNRR